VNKNLWWKFEEISIVFNLMKNCVRTIVEGFQLLITLGLKVLEFHVKLDLVTRGKTEWIIVHIMKFLIMLLGIL
jgi:hypothetical protein